eukprot:Gb_29206 [translate_table: standard]
MLPANCQTNSSQSLELLNMRRLADIPCSDPTFYKNELVGNAMCLQVGNHGKLHYLGDPVIESAYGPKHMEGWIGLDHKVLQSNSQWTWLRYQLTRNRGFCSPDHGVGVHVVWFVEAVELNKWPLGVRDFPEPTQIGLDVKI